MEQRSFQQGWLSCRQNVLLPAPRRRWLSSHRDTCTSYMLSQYSRSSSGISLSQPTWVAWIGRPSRERRRGPAAFCRKFGGDVSLRRAFAKMVRWVPHRLYDRTSWRAWLCIFVIPQKVESWRSVFQKPTAGGPKKPIFINGVRNGTPYKTAENKWVSTGPGWWKNTLLLGVLFNTIYHWFLDPSCKMCWLKPRSYIAPYIAIALYGFWNLLVTCRSLAPFPLHHLKIACFCWVK